MSSFIRTQFVCLIVSLVSLPGFSQEANPKKDAQPEKEQSKTEVTNDEPSKTDGLRKITTRPQYRDWDFDIQIDEKALEANIEEAIENAMRSVEFALERLEIHIEPIEINLGNLDVDVNPIVINIRDLDIDIEPIEVEMDDMDIDIDIDNDDFDWNDNDDDMDIDNDDFDRDDDDDEEEALREKGLNNLTIDQDKNKENDKMKDKSNKDKGKSNKEDKAKSKGLKKIN